MNLINKNYINEYLKMLNTFPHDKEMEQIIKYAKDNDIPILRPETASLLNIIVQAKKPETALEIGTSIGFSGLVILRAMNEDGRLVSVDMDETSLEIARENFRLQGFAERITLINNDTGEVLHNLTDSFDLIFIDGPKAQYINYLSYCIKLLNKGGILICDDVLFYGMVADNKLVNRRKITIVKRLRKFLKIISSHPQLDTSIIPIGDGLSISIRK